MSNFTIRDIFQTSYDSFSEKGQFQSEEPRKTAHSIIHRYLMHVLPSGFQKICYYAFLNNRMKSENLKLIFKFQGHQRFQRKYAGMSMAEILKAVWNFDISVCPACGCCTLKPAGKVHASSF